MSKKIRNKKEKFDNKGYIELRTFMLSNGMTPNEFKEAFGKPGRSREEHGKSLGSWLGNAKIVRKSKR